MYIVNNKCYFTPNLVAAELPLFLVGFFNCFKSMLCSIALVQIITKKIYPVDRPPFAY